MDKRLLLRKQRNRELIERYKKGDSLSLIPPSATFFPPRPIIEKDPQALKFIFGDKKDDDPAPGSN